MLSDINEDDFREHFIGLHIDWYISLAISKIGLSEIYPYRSLYGDSISRYNFGHLKAIL